jgi:NADPH:quinone reductase-like Zn-dependent oxidoreductase
MSRFSRTGEGFQPTPPTPSNLERLAHLLDAGSLRVHIQDTYGLEEAGAALQALAGAHVQRKIAIRIA